jgi:hypothetical protein
LVAESYWNKRGAEKCNVENNDTMYVQWLKSINKEEVKNKTKTAATAAAVKTTTTTTTGKIPDEEIKNEL